MTSRKFARPLETCARLGAALDPLSTGRSDVVVIPSARSTPAKSRNVPARSKVAVAASMTFPCSIPGPKQIKGTPIAGCQGFDFACCDWV